MPDFLKRRARMNDPEVFPLVAEEHAAAIGYVAIQWSAIEGALVALIGRLLGIERPATVALVAERPSPAVLNLIGVLIQLGGEVDAIADWAVLAKRHEAIRPLRNKAIHAEWVVSGNQHLALKSKIRGRLSFSMNAVSTQSLNKLADDALELAEDIMKFGVVLTRKDATKSIISPYPPGLYEPILPIHRLKPPANPSPRFRKPSSAQKRSAAKKG